MGRAAGWTFIALAAGACGTSPMKPNPRAGPSPCDGTPAITAFIAEPEYIPRASATELSWRAENAGVVEIAGPDGTLVSTYDLSGAVRTSTLYDDTGFTITADCHGRSVTSSVAVSIDWAPPSIGLFSTSETVSGDTSTIKLSWTVADTREVELRRDGALIHSRRITTNSTGTYNDVVPLRAKTVHTLTALNPRGSATRSATITHEAVPAIAELTLEPQAIDGAADLTLSWSTINAAGTALSLNAVMQPMFPGTTAGTFAIPGVSTPITVELTAFALPSMAKVSATLHAAPIGTESEPNDSATTAQTIDAGVRAAIDRDGDVDVFRLPPPEPGTLHVWVGDDAATCSLHFSLRLDGPLQGAPLLDSDPSHCFGFSIDVPVPAGDVPPLLFVSAGAGETGAYKLYVANRFKGP
jgi:hypothetical protein